MARTKQSARKSTGGRKRPFGIAKGWVGDYRDDSGGEEMGIEEHVAWKWVYVFLRVADMKAYFTVPGGGTMAAVVQDAIAGVADGAYGLLGCEDELGEGAHVVVGCTARRLANLQYKTDAYIAIGVVVRREVGAVLDQHTMARLGWLGEVESLDISGDRAMEIYEDEFDRAEEMVQWHLGVIQGMEDVRVVGIDQTLR
jgi:hypothetical protein